MSDPEPTRTVTLRPVTLDECQLVRVWRNAPDVLPTLRTGAKTEADQAAFYRDVVANPASDHRYYAVEADGVFIGLGGLTYLSRRPREAEMSLMFSPAYRQCGYEHPAVAALLQQALTLGLTRVIGECYLENPVLGFWRQLCAAPTAPFTGVETHDEPHTMRIAWTA